MHLVFGFKVLRLSVDFEHILSTEGALCVYLRNSSSEEKKSFIKSDELHFVQSGLLQVLKRKIGACIGVLGGGCVWGPPP